MIVKNEAANIERCLASVAPVIGAWVIGDTGSTDDTPERITRFFAARGIPGELHRFPFVNFGQARNEALDRCCRSPLAFDYILFADADMELVIGDGSCLERLTAAAYLVQQRNEVLYDNVRLVRRDAEARYVGVTHEYLGVQGDQGRLAGIWYIDHATGSNRVGKFERDARLLEEDLVRDPNNVRSVFYLAQSYRDAGRLEDALAGYRRRVTMGGWDEEVWFSMYQVAKLTERPGQSPAEIAHAYLAAYQYRPRRAEPLVDLAGWHRGRSEWALARLYARAAQAIPRPDDMLFLMDEAYRWRADDEAAIAAYYTGDPLECFALSWSLLDTDRVPEPHRSRIEANRDFAVPAVAAITEQYPADIVQRLADRNRSRPAGAGVTLTLTSGQRLESFERTINSFLHCCRDVDAIGRFVCIDGNSNAADRARMQERYPFFEFLLQSPDERGQARSMNRLLDTVATPYWLHLEDDWHFFVTMDYVERALSILEREPTVAQVLFNRNFAETLADRVLVGGTLRRHPERGLRYLIHEHVAEGPARDAFRRRFAPDALSNVARPHFAIRPSLLRAEALRGVGRFDEASESFEQDFGLRYTAAGLQSAFFDAVTCMYAGYPGGGCDGGKPSVYPPNALWQWQE
jgi:tetratricopeptide (TPR) repeat protein